MVCNTVSLVVTKSQQKSTFMVTICNFWSLAAMVHFHYMEKSSMKILLNIFCDLHNNYNYKGL